MFSLNYVEDLFWLNSEDKHKGLNSAIFILF